MSNNSPKKIVLPSKGMEEAAKAAQADFVVKQSNSEKDNSTVQKTKPSKETPSSTKNKGTDTFTDDLQTLQDGIAKYTGIEEHGMSVWVVKAVKKRLDELKFRTGNKVGYRAFTNATLELVLDKYGDEIVKAFNQD